MMATGDIEHKELPDDLLHEPKGASTASRGTVYIADGNGAGTFTKLPLIDLEYDKEHVQSATIDTIEDTVAFNGSTLSVIATGSLTDVPATSIVPLEVTNGINKVAAELNRLYTNQREINTAVKADIVMLQNTLNSVINSLKALGLYDE